MRFSELADAMSTLEGEKDLTACILDHYGLGLIWESAVQSRVNVLALDDLGRSHDVRWLLDQNYYAYPRERYKNKIGPNVKTLLGPRYALLRSEFQFAKRKAKVRENGINNVLVFFGGMDFNNVTGIALSAIEASLPPEVDVTVIAGVAHPALESLRSWCAGRRGATLKVQVFDMAPYLLAADLAIGAGGSNTWERCVCGLPTVAVCLAENQREVIREGSEAGFLWGFDGIPDVAELSGVLKALTNAPGLIIHMSRIALSVTDGFGAHRVADILMPRHVCVRNATENDARLIYEWRTHPSVLSVSNGAQPFLFEEHLVWLHKTLADPDRILLVGNYQECDVGVVRFDIEGIRAQVSIFLSPDFICKGLGQALLSAAESQLKILRPEVCWVDAWVNEGNQPSLNMFKQLGYFVRNRCLEKEIA